MPDEVEGKLIITAPDAERVYEAIAALDAVGGCRVARREVEQLTDAYFDGPERPLFSVGLALRVRSVNGRELLTVKGESRVQDGVISREELEVDWSPEGFDEVLETLSQAGVSLGDIEAARERTSAQEAVEALGFFASSPRSNRRVALTLMREGEGEVVAELDVDAVTFTVDGRPVCHYEVECEAKGAGDAAVLHAVLDELRSRHEGLQAWSVSKLALGEALEALSREGGLDALLDGDRLRPEAYEVIERLDGEALQEASDAG
jgi:inorganic triphosphatase YgiF